MGRATALVGWGVLLVGAAGCGASNGPTDVTGTVRFQGQPMTSGEVTFVAADGARKVVRIGPQGQYSVKQLARGKARIAVESLSKVPPGLMKPGPGAVREKEEKPVEIPKRYNSPDESGLSVEVKGGRMTHPIDLTAP
jgi:hypothetical protein